MNALYKTLSLSACALLVFKLHTWPTYQALLTSKNQLSSVQAGSQNAQKMLDFANSLPAVPAQLLGPDQALAFALDVVHGQAPDYGIKISQVMARDVPITQQIFETTALRTEDGGTDTVRQQLLIKGSYIDLDGLRSYLKSVLSPARGLVVSDLSIKGNAIEVGLRIHSARQMVPQAPQSPELQPHD